MNRKTQDFYFISKDRLLSEVISFMLIV